MKTKNFDAKTFLNLKTLTPLEENVIKGGLLTPPPGKQKQKQKQK